MPPEPATDALVALGFNALEAEVYVHLLGASPATGYAAAKALGKPAANVYKALESLAQKGAIVVEESGSRRCRAVPADEILRRLERDFTARRATAAAALARLPHVAEEDARLYHLRAPAPVFERARAMLRAAEQVVLLDLFPEPLALLRNELAATAARGVRVIAKIYAPDTIQGVRLVLGHDHGRVRRRWRGQWLNVFQDGSEFLFAFLSPDGARVLQAVWSGSPYLAWIHHSAFAGELAFSSLEGALREPSTPARLRELAAEAASFFTPDAPGSGRLQQHLDAEFTDRPAAGDSR